MNVQDVIEKALAGNDGIPVTPVEHSSCENVQVEKLAAALNFIGTNLESSVDDLEQEKSAYHLPAIATVAGGVGAHKARERLRRAGLTEDDIDENQTVAGGALRGFGRGLGYGMLGGVVGPVGTTAGGLFGAYRGYQDAQERANRAIEKDRVRRSRDSGEVGERKKTASADDALYQAAQVGKQALLEKVAEDRINPAQISAGPAAPYSGEIMPKGENVFGGQTTPAQLIAMKAQKVRARINGDMKKFVNNVGSGYNLEGHLNKMNK